MYKITEELHNAFSFTLPYTQMIPQQKYPAHSNMIAYTNKYVYTINKTSLLAFF